MEAGEWWTDTKGFRGFTYDDLAADGTDTDLWSRLEWIRREPTEYVPGAYEQLAAALRRAGRDEDAREVSVQKLIHRRRTLKGARRTVNWLLSAAAGYGYRPWRTAVLFLSVVALTTRRRRLGVAGTPAVSPECEHERACASVQRAHLCCRRDPAGCPDRTGGRLRGYRLGPVVVPDERASRLGPCTSDARGDHRQACSRLGCRERLSQLAGALAAGPHAVERRRQFRDLPSGRTRRRHRTPRPLTRARACRSSRAPTRVPGNVGGHGLGEVSMLASPLEGAGSARRPGRSRTGWSSSARATPTLGSTTASGWTGRWRPVRWLRRPTVRLQRLRSPLRRVDDPMPDSVVGVFAEPGVDGQSARLPAS